MNWIQGIQRAIDYVEANITEELDFDDVARQAFSSPEHAKGQRRSPRRFLRRERRLPRLSDCSARIS